MKQRVEDIPVEVQAGELTTRYIEWGDMALRHASVPADIDFGPVLEGLPENRCPSPHWGLVLEGSINLTHHDGTTERVRAGELYYWPAGHTAWTDEATVFLEVGPVVQMRQFSEHAKSKIG